MKKRKLLFCFSDFTAASLFIKYLYGKVPAAVLTMFTVKFNL